MAATPHCASLNAGTWCDVANTCLAANSVADGHKCCIDAQCTSGSCAGIGLCCPASTADRGLQKPPSRPHPASSRTAKLSPPPAQGPALPALLRPTAQTPRGAPPPAPASPLLAASPARVLAAQLPSRSSGQMQTSALGISWCAAALARAPRASVPQVCWALWSTAAAECRPCSADLLPDVASQAARGTPAVNAVPLSLLVLQTPPGARPTTTMPAPVWLPHLALALHAIAPTSAPATTLALLAAADIAAPRVSRGASGATP